MKGALMNAVFVVCVFFSSGWVVVEWEPEEPKRNLSVIDRFGDVDQQLLEFEAGGAPRNEQEALATELVEQMAAEFGGDVLMQQAVFAEAEGRRKNSQERRYLAPGFLVGRYLRPTLEERIEYLGPYWSLSDNELRTIIRGIIHSAGNMLDRDSEMQDSDIREVVARLQVAREAGDTRYQGLIDYLFERDALVAWLALVEADGVGEPHLTDKDDKLKVFARPYRNQRARTDPSRVDPQVLDECRALLREFVQGDSLWARVFAAEILNKVSYMRDPDIEAALREDPHWLIQRRMAYLDEAAPEAEQE